MSLHLLSSHNLIPAKPEDEFNLAEEMRHRKHQYIASEKMKMVSVYCPKYLTTLTTRLAKKIGTDHDIRTPGLSPMMSASILHGVTLLHEHPSITQLIILQQDVASSNITDTSRIQSMNQWRDSFSANFSISDPLSSGTEQKNTYINDATKTTINELNSELGISMSHLMTFAWMLTMLSQSQVSDEYKLNLQVSLESFFNRIDGQYQYGSIILQAVKRSVGPRAIEEFLAGKTIRELTIMFQKENYTRQKLISLIHRLVNEE